MMRQPAACDDCGGDGGGVGRVEGVHCHHSASGIVRDQVDQHAGPVGLAHGVAARGGQRLHKVREGAGVLDAVVDAVNEHIFHH
eukprot:3701615-Prymnesium_polylepis.1